MTAERADAASVWRRLKPLLGLLMTALFLALILRQIDVAGSLAAFADLALPWLLLALVLLAADYALRIIRWWWMLRALEPALPASSCVWPYLSSIAVNNVLPFRAGDALRAFGFRRQLRSPATRILGTLVIERMLDMATLLPLFFVGLVAAPTALFPRTLAVSAAWLAGSLAVLLVLLLALTPRLPALVTWMARRPALANRGWSDALEHWGGNFVETFTVLRRPLDALVLVGLSMAVWLLEAGVFAAVAIGFDAGVGPFGALFAMSTGTLSTLIPSSPGYIGTFDYFTLTALTVYGMGESIAAAAALTIHAVLWVPLTVLGLGHIFLRGRGLWATAMRSTAKDRVAS